MTLRSQLAESPFARVATMPLRAAQAGRYDAQLVGKSARWLATSREHTNFTYDLTPINRDYLAWWVAGITGAPVTEVRRYFAELLEDQELAEHIRRYTRTSARRRLADDDVRWHRHLGWYALVRILRPRHIVETGTDKGRGTLVFASAIQRNNIGRVTTIDNNPASGYLIQPPYDEVVSREIGDSLDVLRDLDTPVDVFLHDSLHTREHETGEYDAIAPALSEGAVVMSDNAHCCDALARWAESNHRLFSFFQEQPERHWYPGAGIGLSLENPFS